ncbi:flagellar biosynthesis regulator FlhF [Tabrizicola sp. TH137]|uniref:flagellar biosynthesis regulator FlaF n=1 Tax=Tabrizicola sp. TH137 TaxID=2067452 RepID=UPI000C7C38A5|nr:flagellar biosynthesis regulator FlaF [Tabrizicola sp. TH137]PLL14629.1 flagellar biosynthesis regulator FlhF [Tabrizicola sp. TH137]
MHHEARAAYGRPDMALRSPRALEYDLLARATAALRAAEEGQGGFPALAAALDRNLRLWRTLAVDVADAGNGLPPALRAQLFYIYEFTALHSRTVLEGRGDAGALVAINTAVMRGLRGEVAA